MPKLTSGLTQKERLEVLQSIDVLKSKKNAHEQKILQIYRNMIAESVYTASLPRVNTFVASDSVKKQNRFSGLLSALRMKSAE